MDCLAMISLFGGIYNNKTVLITGHSGFKGTWLSYWLTKMGANVVGYSLNIPTVPNHLGFLKMNIHSVFGDIRDSSQLESVINQYEPDIVFHLAAQSLVRPSYIDPIETYETNVIGTLKVFEACRKNNIKAIVNITSDKAYDNREQIWGYRENDRLGGYDPYSSSKGCAELLTNSYRNSYFNLEQYKKTHHTLLASCRAGNVIGGGDWAIDRLLTDIIISVSQGREIKIRNPNATRPWQHVLEPLSGYLHVGQKLLEGDKNFASEWNFGPSDNSGITVIDVVENIKKLWGKIRYKIEIGNEQPHEAILLTLDCTKAHSLLKWESVWDSSNTFEKTVRWYKSFYENNNEILTDRDLNDYINDAIAKGLAWTKS